MLSFLKKEDYFREKVIHDAAYQSESAGEARCSLLQNSLGLSNFGKKSG